MNFSLNRVGGTPVAARQTLGARSVAARPARQAAVIRAGAHAKTASPVFDGKIENAQALESINGGRICPRAAPAPERPPDGPRARWERQTTRASPMHGAPAPRHTPRIC